MVFVCAGFATEIGEAIKAGDLDAVRKMVAADLSIINHTNSQGVTPLNYAHAF